MIAFLLPPSSMHVKGRVLETFSRATLRKRILDRLSCTIRSIVAPIAVMASDKSGNFENGATENPPVELEVLVFTNMQETSSWKAGLALIVHWYSSRYVTGDTSNKRKRKRRSEMAQVSICLLYTSPSPRDRQKSRMPSSA